MFSLAKGESLKSTGERRRAARRRGQEQGQEQTVELTSAAGAAVRGAAQDLTLLNSHGQGEDQIMQPPVSLLLDEWPTH